MHRHDRPDIPAEFKSAPYRSLGLLSSGSLLKKLTWGETRRKRSKKRSVRTSTWSVLRSFSTPYRAAWGFFNRLLDIFNVDDLILRHSARRRNLHQVTLLLADERTCNRRADRYTACFYIGLVIANDLVDDAVSAPFGD